MDEKTGEQKNYLDSLLNWRGARFEGLPFKAIQFVVIKPQLKSAVSSNFSNIFYS